MSEFMIRSYVPGRLRVRHPELKGLDVEMCQGMVFFIESIEGVTGCSINPRIGSLLLTWDPEKVTLETLIAQAPMVVDMPDIDALARGEHLTTAQKAVFGATRGVGQAVAALVGNTPEGWRSRKVINRLALISFLVTLFALPLKNKALHVAAGAVMSVMIGGHLFQHKKYI